ncbi:Membrane protein involved in the export of O-antigen and teichoic acid [Marinobacter daqiaonensis]|uniref:Membrane protein involved in the export of O-antigen and teichoic acid n=1 Tax=Marinobacter daqiaonensis TaxID=650891 RepID=A0A1I6K148_9GAMM|nr:oligosaccharide flippase family protein [Marinobacter daqiaonensis]SFR84904.1 Membrane protein involved in the export of O-antigen and teichoic acid [Marinobacter daqiaonensis]
MKLRRRFLPADVTGNVFRGMATLALGSSVGRFIGIASMPVLTRLYGPEDYGVLAVFSAMVFMLAPVLTLRYVMAVPLPRHDGTAINLMALSLALTVVITLLVTALLFAFADPILSSLSMTELAPWWWLVLLAMVGTSGYETLTAWATRRRGYRTIARTQVSQNLMGAAIKIGLGLLAIKPGGLLIGQMASQVGGIGTYLRHFRHDIRANARFVSLRRMKLVAGRYRGFPVYRLPSKFLLVYSVQAPVLFFSAIYGAGATGHLGLALAAMALPVTLVSQSLADAFFAELSTLDRRDIDTQWHIVVRVIKVVSAISVPVFLLLFFFAKPFSVVVFGEDWATTGVFLTALSPYIVVQLIANPVTKVLAVHEMHRVFLWINIQRALLISAVFLLAFWLDWPAIIAISVFSGVLFAHYVFCVVVTLKLLRNKMKNRSTG